uniref:Putative secreted protein n=1 Tax=Anopheles triannulatus TaxID=58253 RepID=A0A2M4B7D7_9DIPT
MARRMTILLLPLFRRHFAFSHVAAVQSTVTTIPKFHAPENPRNRSGKAETRIKWKVMKIPGSFPASMTCVFEGSSLPVAAVEDTV